MPRLCHCGTVMALFHVSMTKSTVEKGACQAGAALLTAVYIIGLTWVPAVVAKVHRAAMKIFMPKAENSDKNLQFSPRVIRRKGAGAGGNVDKDK